MKKRTAVALVSGFLMICFCLMGWAAAEREPVIQDDADLLTSEEEAALYQEMLPLCEYGTPMFWTTTEAGDYETLSENFLHSRVGQGGDGVVFTINMLYRQLIISADGAVYRVVNRAEEETITDNVFRMAGRGEYYACASSAFQQMLQLLKGEQIDRPMKTAGNVLLGLVLALLGVYIYVSTRYETRPKFGKAGAALPVTAAAAATFAAVNLNRERKMIKQKKTDISSDSDGGGGGGFSGGGGGGSSGGSGSHGF